MKMSFRWYGESDPISLEYISQIPGMHSIVSAVYDVKPGEVWPEESLAKMKAQCEAHGLVFDVVESIPVHEDIKLGRNNVDELLDLMMQDAVQSTGKQLSMLTKEDKVAVVRYLDEKGAFLIKKSAEKVADFLGISRFTVYNYLNEPQ